jgi:DNA topoisomerase-1
MKALVIVESPTKARTLGPILGAGYTVRASMGHVRDLPTDELGVDVANDFRPSYHILRQKSKTIKALRDALAQANIIYLATDPDREGEAIAWHLLQTLKPRGLTVQRVTFHEITPHAIQDAFGHPRSGVDMALVNAQQARRILDRLVGYQVSPLLWKTTQGKSAGRVQSVALRLVVEREREIRNFVPQEYWSILADLAKIDNHQQHFLARLVQVGALKVGLDQPIHLKSQADAGRVIAALTGAEYRVKSVKQEKKTRKPWPPFTTSTLQQSASARLGMSPAEAMKIAQELYEGVDIGAGKPVGLITYMRTDSTAISAEAQAAAREMITQTLGTPYLPAAAPSYKTRVKNAQEAHEAIRPTDVWRYPNTLKEHLSDRQFRVYDLIWRRFVASQMAPAVYDVTTVDVGARPAPLPPDLHSLIPLKEPVPEFLFRAVGRVLAFEGFLRVWQESDDKSDEDEEPQQLPPLSAQELLHLLKLIPRQHFTQPPPRYTEATLIKAMEDRGIGRPSTYAQIMATLKQREYVVPEKRQLRPTRLGEHTCDALIAAFPDMMDYQFTAQVEDWLDDISRGETEWVKALRDFYTPFASSLASAEPKMRATPMPDVPADAPHSEHGEAEAAGGASGEVDTSAPTGAKRKRSKRGATAGAAPSRKSTARSSAGRGRKGTRTARPAPVQTDVKCPLCGAPMVQRTGSRGPFLGCSRYPACKGTRNLTQSA